MRKKVVGSFIPVLLSVASSSLALSQTFDSVPSSPSKTAPVYRVTVVQRTVKAINYQYRSGPTMIDFAGTVLLSSAKGHAIVESKQGRTTIDAKLAGLASPHRYGPEYLTYVLWAVTPEGRCHNLGELLPGSSDSARIQVTTDLQAFALVVTAEPYSAVRTPSDVVVAENRVRPDTEGVIRPVEAKFELLPRGEYTWQVPGNWAEESSSVPKVSMREYQAISELYQARNAVGVAESVKARQDASDSFARAQSLLTEAERMHNSKADYRLVVQRAREAAQTAEDARVIALKRQQQRRAAAAAAEESALQAKLQNVEQLRNEAELEKQRALAREQQARASARAAEAAREKAEAEFQNAQAEAAAARSHAEESDTRAAMDKLQLSRELSRAKEKERRLQLLAELRAALPSLDTPRGLVATVPDDAFRGSALLPAYATRLSRVAGILRQFPDLQITVEGNSDSAARDLLSGERAEAVRTVLLHAGLSPSVVTAAVLGDRRPLGPNDTPQNRKENSRVEIVVTGEPIGSLATWQKTYLLTPGK